MATLSDLLSQAAATRTTPRSPTPVMPGIPAPTPMMPGIPATPMPQSSGVASSMYGGGAFPPWVPPNVRSYILTHPSYSEGGPQGTWGAQGQGEPAQPPNPQIGDIQRLFGNTIQGNAPSGNPISGPFLKNIIQGGYLAGGVNI